MEPYLVTVEPTESCERALMLMRAGSLDVLPVVERGRVVGLVTESDIERRAPRDPDQKGDADGILAHIHVSGVMRYAPPIVLASASLVETAAKMMEWGLGAVPVVDGERLVGLIDIRSAHAALAGSSTRRGVGKRRVAAR